MPGIPSFKTLRPGDACMRQWMKSSLVQVITCRLFGAKPLPEPILTFCHLDPSWHASVEFHQNTHIFIRENVFENIVCKISSSLSGPKCVNTSRLCGAYICQKTMPLLFNALRPRQHGRHFPDDIFRSIFVNENIWLSIKISFVPNGPINNIPALDQNDLVPIRRQALLWTNDDYFTDAYMRRSPSMS